jgi:ATP adenylyltransferase/5',5'''-P-1,P-4-tetraphosphate phosphorylase II
MKNNRKLIESLIVEDDKLSESINADEYTNASERLLKLQLEDWTQLKKGYKSLATVKTKSFWYSGFKVLVQFNPGRLKSTSAEVDKESINERECFLCAENLPEAQKGIGILRKYLILCNPYPIFPEHFTIASLEHQPQEILSSFEDLIDITRKLSSKYSVIYNGPKCGASAPDHLHFQAGTKNFMPVEDEFNYLKNEYGEIITETSNLIISAVDDGLRKFISIETKDSNLLNEVFQNIYNTYDSLNNGNEEPMMNIVSSYEEEFGWRLIIFLRSKHRSSHYYLEGKEKIMISPAAIDLGGVCIAPVERDFKKVSREIIAGIFYEVSLFQEGFVYLKSTLKKHFSG